MAFLFFRFYLLVVSAKKLSESGAVNDGGQEKA